MWEWAVEFKALLVFVGSHVGVRRIVQGSVRVCRVSCGSGPESSMHCSGMQGLMFEWALQFNALLVFVGSHVGVGRRIQGTARVCRVSCGSGP